MMKKPWFIILLIAAGLAGATIIAYNVHAAHQPLICQVCGRAAPRQTEFHLFTKKGELIACCPRCAMHYMLNHPGEVRGARATDYFTGVQLDARAAIYDEGGRRQFCTLKKPDEMRGPHRGERMRVYDRCLPVLVAFSSRAEANRYRRQYGGRLLSYGQALQSVREH